MAVENREADRVQLQYPDIKKCGKYNLNFESYLFQMQYPLKISLELSRDVKHSPVILGLEHEIDAD
jgi:hypothetical protein